MACISRNSKREKRYKQFLTRAKAEKFIREEKIRQTRQGEMAYRAAPEDVAEYLELPTKLKSQDASPAGSLH